MATDNGIAPYEIRINDTFYSIFSVKCIMLKEELVPRHFAMSKIFILGLAINAPISKSIRGTKIPIQMYLWRENFLCNVCRLYLRHTIWNMYLDMILIWIQTYLYAKLESLQLLGFTPTVKSVMLISIPFLALYFCLLL